MGVSNNKISTAVYDHVSTHVSSSVVTISALVVQSPWPQRTSAASALDEFCSVTSVLRLVSISDAQFLHLCSAVSRVASDCTVRKRGAQRGRRREGKDVVCADAE